jgi:outer membrane protein
MAFVYMINKILNFSLLSVCVYVCTPTLLQADDLLDVYYQAQRTSPSLKSQDFLAQAGSLADPIARAALFPVISANANLTHVNIKGGSNGGAGGTFGLGSLSLTQPIFNYSSYQLWRSGQWSAKEAQATFSYQKQVFITGVANAYFAILQAQESLEYRLAAKKSYALTLEQTKEKMKVGLATENDVKQALADYDSSVAEAIKAKNNIIVARLGLYVYTGDVSENLAQLRDNFPFVKPVGNIDKWVKAAKFHNNSLIAQQDLMQSDAHVLSSSKSTYLPSVSLSANYNYIPYSQGNSIFSGVGDYLRHKSFGSVAINLTWALFNSGAGFETVKQNAANYAAQEALTYYAQRDVVNQTRQDYLAVVAGAAQVKALKSAVLSGEVAVNQALAQYQVGTVTIVDVLEKIRLLYKSKQTYTQSKYDYIKSKLALALDAGVLELGDIKSLNAWLTHDLSAKNTQISKRY